MQLPIASTTVFLRVTRGNIEVVPNGNISSICHVLCLIFLRESLYEIFYRCDLDGNGFLSRKEFGIFQKRTSGEECDDGAWEVVKGIFYDFYPTPKGRFWGH